MTPAPTAPAPPGPWNPGLASTLPRRFLPLSTMFRPENVSNSLADAEGLADFCGLAAFDLAAFRPERLVVHELLIRVMGDLSVPDGARYEDLGINSRRMTARLLEHHIVPHLPAIREAFEALKASARARLTEMIEAHVVSAAAQPSQPEPRPAAVWRRLFARPLPPPTASASSLNEQRDLELLADWRRAAEQATTPLDRALLHAAAGMAASVIRRHGRLIGDPHLLADIALTLFANDYGSAFVGGRIDPLFRAGAAAEGYRLLPPQQRAIVMNVKGASAAGKSTMRPQQRLLARRLGVRWEDFALISPDIWRKFLLDYDTLGEAVLYAGTLTGHELEVIDRKLDRYMAAKAGQGLMTHLLIDRFRFDSFAADGAVEDGSQLLTRFGSIVYMFFMITPPDATVERAWKRGLQFGRYKAVDDLLAHNVEAYTGMPRLFFTWAQRAEKTVHYEFLDNAVAEGALPRTVAYGIGGDLTILDPKFLIDVDRYRKIDVGARRPQDVYPSRAAMAPENNTAFLRECVREIPRLTFAEHASGRLYARVENGRLVAWNALAAELCARDPEISAALAAVGGLPDRLPAPTETLEGTQNPDATDTLGAWAGRTAMPQPQPETA